MSGSKILTIAADHFESLKLSAASAFSAELGAEGEMKTVTSEFHVVEGGDLLYTSAFTAGAEGSVVLRGAIGPFPYEFKLTVKLNGSEVEVTLDMDKPIDLPPYTWKFNLQGLLKDAKGNIISASGLNPVSDGMTLAAPSMPCILSCGGTVVLPILIGCLPALFGGPQAFIACIVAKAGTGAAGIAMCIAQKCLGHDGILSVASPSGLQFNDLKEEYAELFDKCVIRADRLDDVKSIADRAFRFQDRYLAAGTPFNIPWYVIACIHNAEAALNFNGHLHNGDPLRDRTVHVPKGRPLMGDPPFTWEESARDALKFDGLDKWTDWSIHGILYNFEKYNGWGYRLHHPHVLSPYLWSFSNHYTSGGYSSDHQWSDSFVWRQCGCAVLFKYWLDNRIITIP